MVNSNFLPSYCFEGDGMVMGGEEVDSHPYTGIYVQAKLVFTERLHHLREDEVGQDHLPCTVYSMQNQLCNCV